MAALGPLQVVLVMLEPIHATDATDATGAKRFAPGIPGVITNNMGGLNYQSGIMGSNVISTNVWKCSVKP